ncbi:MAG: CNNM domain-containing protein [Bdellovibrionota bacterium]|nr:CNNM domain-containing protein [Bdellovibrionota bacterium]
MLTFYVFLSVLVSFTCSLLEAVILSVTPAYLNLLKKQNPLTFERVSFLEDDIEKPLASILTLNTIAHTIGATGAGAEAQKIWGNEYLSLFSAVLTFIILFFSEIIPKSIGARAWKRVLPYCHYLLRPMIIVSLPIIWASRKISALIKGDEKDVVSREEIPALAELGLQDGTIGPAEFHKLQSMMDFAKVKVKDILTPFNKVGILHYQSPIDEAYQHASGNTYSRLIVLGVHKDDIKGYVMRKDILQGLIEKKPLSIKDITNPILILPETTPAQVLFDRLLARKAHIAAVLNAKGDFIGIVTLEDLIETLMGTPIYDEFDRN